jgi:hypothetical protein
VTLERLITAIEAQPGLEWLVRNDEKHGAFANITYGGKVWVNQNPGVRVTASEYRYPTFAPTPIMALRIAFDRAQSDRNNGQTELHS